MIPVSPRNVNSVKDSIIHFHNVQILGKRLIPLKYINHLHKNGNKVIVGLRGENGKQKYDKLLWKADAVATGVDPSLRDYALSHNNNVYVLPPGVDHELFRPLSIEKDRVVSWVGRSHKKFKNYDLLPRLGYSYRVASYEKYVAHDRMPFLYNSTLVCVGFSDFEGFWRPCVEAALCGLPVISTGVGVVPELIQKNYIVPLPASEHLDKYRWLIQGFIDDPELVLSVGRRNRIIAHRYSWRNVAPLYDKAWSELM